MKQMNNQQMRIRNLAYTVALKESLSHFMFIFTNLTYPLGFINLEIMNLQFVLLYNLGVCELFH